MALKPCKDCKKEISTDAQSCPNCGAKNPTRLWSWWQVLLGIIFLAALSSFFDKKETKDTQTPDKQSNLINKQFISYKIIKRWDIPNGGEGKVIAIDISHLNKKDMHSLGETLKKDTENDRNAVIFIFTSEKAALLRDKIGKLNKSESDFYDKHFVGSYMRNINNGYHEYSINYDGLSGKNSESIKY